MSMTARWRHRPFPADVLSVIVLRDGIELVCVRILYGPVVVGECRDDVSITQRLQRVSADVISRGNCFKRTFDGGFCVRAPT